MTSQTPTIAVVGSLHYDILVDADDRPRKGETVFGHRWSWKCGGKGGNQAVEAARHGGAVAFIGAVGDDDFAAALRANLAAAGVETTALRVVAGVGSGMSVATFDAGGDYGAVIVPGANWHIAQGDVAAAPALAAARIVLLQNEVRPEINLAAARRAKAAGATVILNAAPARDLSPDLLACVDLLVVNEIEAEALTGGAAVASLDDAEAAAMALLRLAGVVVVTAGPHGYALAEARRPPRREAAHPVAVLSTHGAGDAFVGALAARLAAGASMADAARYANAAAAALVATPQSQRAALSPVDAEALIARRNAAVLPGA